MSAHERSPDRATYVEQVAAASTGGPGEASFVPLWKRWPADLETPLTTWLKAGAGSSHGVLLESVEGGERLGRWSFVVSDPLWTLTCRGERAERRWRDGRHDDLAGNPFQLLRQCVAAIRPAPVPGLPPLGQLFGFWGYELIHWIEPSVPVHPVAPGAPPDGCWMLADSLLVFDQVKRQITAVAYVDLSDGADPGHAWDHAAARIASLEARMHAPLASGVEPLHWHDADNAEVATALPTASNFSEASFIEAVRRAEQHIACGDVFQLVLSQRLETTVQRDPFDLYRSLRMVNPSPYMAFFNFGGWHLIGSSPEVMVKAEPCSDGTVRASLRPIAGTRPRGEVSQVEGVLRSDCDVWDLLMASFPAGTVSGAPKIRAMQLIHELEPDARGPYAGVYGAVDLSGALNTAITIRTMVVLPNGDGRWRVQVQAGAGVVADSRPEAEHEETLNKARGMLKALACLLR
jgi:anthranilate synthase component 1